MLKAVLIAALVLLALYISMGLRVTRIQNMRKRAASYEEVSSPLGQAIKDFVTVSGGVYLGLMALAEFLKVPVPIQASLWGMTLDPIALFAVCLAIIVPALPFGKGRF